MKDISSLLKNLIKDEMNETANFANASALIYEFIENINWAGFYIYDEKEDNLVLGPFQGKAACIRIPLGKGVCGTSFKEMKVLRIDDVHEFPGHIACDEASLSELVIPFVLGSGTKGVLDIDSPVKMRFKEDDEKIFKDFIDVLKEHYS